MVELASLSAELGAILEAAYGPTDPTTTPSTNSQGHELLLEDLWEMEKAAAKFRTEVDAFLCAQKTSLMALKVEDKPNQAKEHGLGTNSGKRRTARSILQRRSMSAAYRKRVYKENKAVEYLLDKLDNKMYSSETKTRSDLAKSCMDLAIFLEKSESIKRTIQHGMNKIPKAGRAAKQIKNSEATDTQVLDQDIGNPQTKQEPRPELPEESRETTSLPVVEDTADDIEKLFPFLSNNSHVSSSGIHKVLLIGKEGTGKTHVCNEIEQHALLKRGKPQVVHRLNSFGRTIGELEDNILSLFHSVCALPGHHHILLVDDFDEIVGSFCKGTTSNRDSGVEDKESHASARAFSAFLTAMDSFVAIDPTDKVVLLCTAKSNVNLFLARFDVVQTLESPGYEERRKVLAGFVGHEGQEEGEEVTDNQGYNASLDELAELSVRLSFAELAQNLRLALMARDRIKSIHGEADNRAMARGEESAQLMDALKESLQSFAPASLRVGLVDGYVDMRVLSSQDLLDLSTCPPQSCPLDGSSCELAWKELESNIVIPLCQAKELNLLLCNQAKPSVQSGLSCGIILTGPPGSGKSTLAQHSVAFAAHFNPSIKLLEVSCTSMIHKEVGASEKAIHHLFECARNAAPAILILDDVAIISSVRGKDSTTEGTMDRVLSTLLTELDGVERDFPASSETNGIAVIGVTQNVDWVDPALLRPGRLSRILRLGLPDHDARFKIAMRQLVHFQKMEPKACRELAQVIAGQTEGVTGSSVIAACNDLKKYLAELVANPGDSLITEPEQLLASLRNFVLNRAAG